MDFEDIKKQNIELDRILGINGRHILTEKTINILEEYRKLRANNERKYYTYSEWIQQEFPKMPNFKLWRYISMVQVMKPEVVRTQQYEMAAFLRDIERDAANIIIQRNKNKGY